MKQNEKYRLMNGLALAGICLLMLLPATLSAESAEEIIREVDSRNYVETSSSEMVMLVYPDLRNERDVRRYRFSGKGRGDDASVMVFTEPRSLNGLSLLSLGDDQWIYFPSTGRVRKIASRSKDDSVQGVGGDFSYEDLSAGDWLEKYDFTLIDEKRKTWILEGIPKKRSPYSRIQVVIDRSRYQVEQVLYWTDGEEPTKELVMEDYRDIDGREVPERTIMTNHEKKSRTVIEMQDARWNIPLDEGVFNPNRFWK